jgi:predicted DNA-binding transcriptional regulator AlpA
MELKSPSDLVAEPLINVADVCAVLGVSKRTVESEEFQRRVGLPAIRLGPRMMRFRPSDVRELVARGTGDRAGT